MTGTIKESLAAIEAALAGPNGAAGCFQQLNDIGARLELVIGEPVPPEIATPELLMQRVQQLCGAEL